MKVVTPIAPELRALALSLSGLPAESLPGEVQGREHLACQEGFIAELALMLNVPSISPGETLHLEKISTLLEDALNNLPVTMAAESRAALEPYLGALRLVQRVGLFQTQFVLDVVKRKFVDEPLAEKLNVDIEHLEHAVNLLKLARRKSDGSVWQAGEEWS